MSSISELPRLMPRPMVPAGSGHRTAKAAAPAALSKSVATAPVQGQRPTAPTQAPEPTRSQSAEHRLKRNRLEEGPNQTGTSAPEAEFTFGDFIDLINPLHHIPVIGTIYRAITGDEIGGPAKILGGMLFGGPIGFIASIFDTIIAQTTGRDLGETVLAAFTDGDAAPGVQVANTQDVQNLSAPEGGPQVGGPEDGRPMALSSTAAPQATARPALDHKDPFGLQRGPATPIAAPLGGPMPGALMPGALMPGALMPGALMPGAVTPGVAIRDFGPNSIAAEMTARIDAAGGIAGSVTDRTQSALGRYPLAPIAPEPGALPVPIVVQPASADASRPGIRRLVSSAAATDLGFAERMLEALDKYQALTSERLHDDSRAPPRLDLNL